MHEEQVAKREQMRPFLGQPTIPRFHVTELALDDPEGIFDHRAHHGADPVDLFVDGVELGALGRLAHDASDLAIFAEGGFALGADIAFVGPDGFIFAMEKFVPDPAVMHLCSRGLEAVDVAAVHPRRHLPIASAIAMRMTANRTQTERKRQHRFVRRAEKRCCRASTRWVQGPIRPVPDVCATADTAQGGKRLFSWHNQAIVTTGGRPLGKCRVIAQAGALWVTYTFQKSKRISLMAS